MSITRSTRVLLLLLPPTTRGVHFFICLEKIVILQEVCVHYTRAQLLLLPRPTNLGMSCEE